jgi:Family of unknown function (DUF6600)/FecR protein
VLYSNLPAEPAYPLWGFTMPARWPTFSFFLNAAGALLLFVGPSNAQTPERADPQEPPHLAYIDGPVTLEREGQAELATVNVPVVAGDRIATAAGRAEIIFPDGTVLDVDESSVIEFLAAGLLRLSEGRVLLTVPGVNDPNRAPHYQIDTPVASVRTDSPGEFRIAASGARDASQTELAVLRGYATLVTDRGATSIRAGERMVAFDNGSISSTLPFNSARFDAFDRWTAERREARVGTLSAQYLPNDLRMYSGTFDRNGSWQYDASYGYVWYPTVDAAWQPYYDGYWSPMRSYGWTWIGATVWSWPTHHYGRWGHTRGSWFWIPGRAWGPAWVSWASAPGYVSWCPLGFDSRPVFGLSVGVNSPRAGWVVVPRTSFGYGGYSVNHHAVSPVHLPRATTFTALQTAPVDPRGRLRRAGETSSANGVAAQRRNAPLRSFPESAAPGGAQGTNAARRAIPTDPAGAAPESFVRRRTFPTEPSNSSSNVGQPSPDPSRTFGDRGSFVRPAPTAPEAPFTRTPGGPEAAFPRARRAPPTGSLTETRPPAIPTPPAMPRWAPPNNTQAELPHAMPFPRPLPQTMAPAVPAMPVPSAQPAEQPQSRPAYAAPRYRAAPAAAPAQDRRSSGDSSFGSTGRNRSAPASQPMAPASQPTASTSQPTASASQPSAGSSRAVPRSDGQASSGSDGGRRR